MTLGEKLRQARLELGLSQNQVAGNQITRNMLSQLENDQASPSVKTLSYLSQKLGVSISWLLDDAACEHGEPFLEKARGLYIQGAFKACMDVLLKETCRTEEGCLLLCRSAVAYGMEALQSGTLQEAERAASVAASCESIYLCEQDRADILSLQIRISLLNRMFDEKRMKAWKKICFDQEYRLGNNWIQTHVSLLTGNLQRAEQLLPSLDPQTAFESGYHSLLHGWMAAEKKDYDQAIFCLKLAEENAAVGPVYRMEVYRLLELCYRECRDFQQAYHYAVLRLDGK